MILLVALTALLTQPPEAGRYRWVDYDDGRQLQYGVAETDERAFWISCDESGRLTAGAAAIEAKEGAYTEVVLSGRSGSKTYRGELVERGDGMNFSVAISQSDPIVQSLLADRAIRVTNGGHTYEVPGAGAAVVLRPFLARCSAGSR